MKKYKLRLECRTSIAALLNVKIQPIFVYHFLEENQSKSCDLDTILIVAIGESVFFFCMMASCGLKYSIYVVVWVILLNNPSPVYKRQITPLLDSFLV